MNKVHATKIVEIMRWYEGGVSYLCEDGNAYEHVINTELAIVGNWLAVWANDTLFKLITAVDDARFQQDFKLLDTGLYETQWRPILAR